jgi:hypothetical protein
MRVVRLALLSATAAVGVAAAAEACGGAYNASDVAGSDAAGTDATPDGSDGSAPPGDDASDGGADADADAAPDAHTFCTNVDAALCLDFDRGNDPLKLGVTVATSNGTANIAAAFSVSPPHSFRTEIDTDGGVDAYAYLSKALPFSTAAGMTVSASLYIETQPIGFASAAIQVSTGQTIATYNVFRGSTPNYAGAQWDCFHGGVDDQKNSLLMALGAWHTIEVAIDPGGTIHLRRDGVQDLACPVAQAGATATIQVGLYNTVTSAPETAAAFFDNVVVTSP